MYTPVLLLWDSNVHVYAFSLNPITNCFNVEKNVPLPTGTEINETASVTFPAPKGDYYTEGMRRKRMGVKWEGRQLHSSNLKTRLF